jgi:hypothetical protein
MKKSEIIVAVFMLVLIGGVVTNVLISRREATRQAEAVAVSATRPPSAPKQALQDPEARVALARVGADPAAQKYWVAAINNPGLPANERKDLIEDLNEVGFADPKNPTAAELALIQSRIKLIEELSPHALDEVNAAAFKEAHKDLVNMAARLSPK